MRVGLCVLALVLLCTALPCRADLFGLNYNSTSNSMTLVVINPDNGAQKTVHPFTEKIFDAIRPAISSKPAYDGKDGLFFIAYKPGQSGRKRSTPSDTHYIVSYNLTTEAVSMKEVTNAAPISIGLNPTGELLCTVAQFANGSVGAGYLHASAGDNLSFGVVSSSEIVNAGDLVTFVEDFDQKTLTFYVEFHIAKNDSNVLAVFGLGLRPSKNIVQLPIRYQLSDVESLGNGQLAALVYDRLISQDFFAYVDSRTGSVSVVGTGFPRPAYAPRVGVSALDVQNGRFFVLMHIEFTHSWLLYTYDVTTSKVTHYVTVGKEKTVTLEQIIYV